MSVQSAETRGAVLRSAGARAGRLAERHKLVTAILAVFVVAVIAVSLTGTSSPGSAPRSDPAAPGFTLIALGDPGRHITLSQYQGKPLIVNFWASWCEPCQREAPLLARWYRQRHSQVIIIGLDENDNPASALKFASAKGVGYPIGVDPALTAASAYGVSGLPQTFFLDARHRIVDRVFGAVTEAALTKGTRLMNAHRS